MLIMMVKGIDAILVDPCEAMKFNTVVHPSPIYMLHDIT